MESIPSTTWSESKVKVVGVSVKEEERDKLSTSNNLKLSKSARRVDANKFALFKANGRIVNDFSNSIRFIYAYRSVV